MVREAAIGELLERISKCVTRFTLHVHAHVHAHVRHTCGVSGSAAKLERLFPPIIRRPVVRDGWITLKRQNRSYVLGTRLVRRPECEM